MTKKQKRLLVTAVLIFNPITLLVCLFAGIHWSNTHPDYGVNAPSVRWLPQSASNVSYYRTYSWTAYEIDITEGAFREWAKERQLKEIDESQSIERYSWWNFHSDSMKQRLPYEEYAELERTHTATVTNGLYDRVRQKNGGGYHVVFDREHNRAYWQTNPR